MTAVAYVAESGTITLEEPASELAGDPRVVDATWERDALPQPDLEIMSTDYHTAGEPFRIVTDGAPDIQATPFSIDGPMRKPTGRPIRFVNCWFRSRVVMSTGTAASWFRRATSVPISV